jgi:hypothetical protein
LWDQQYCLAANYSWPNRTRAQQDGQCDNPPGPAPCPSAKPCLFNVIEDIREIHDLSAEQPERLKSIIAEYRAAVRKTPSFAPFDTKSDHFTKAGSGQTSEKLRGKGVLCRAKLTAGRLIRTTVARRGRRRSRQENGTFFAIYI